MNSEQLLAVLQQIIDACAQRGYRPPYDVTIAGEHGARLGWCVDHDGAHELPGDIGSAGTIEIGSRFTVGITDADLRHADFRVDRWEFVDGTSLPPTITTPPEWDSD